MLHEIKFLSGVILLTLMISGCDNDKKVNTTNNEMMPDVSVTPAATLADLLSADATDDPRPLNLTAIQTELDSLTSLEPVSVNSGDSAAALLARAQAL